MASGNAWGQARAMAGTCYKWIKLAAILPPTSNAINRYGCFWGDMGGRSRAVGCRWPVLWLVMVVAGQFFDSWWPLCPSVAHCDVVGQCFGIDTKDGTILKEPQTPRLALPKLIETQQGIVADVQSSGSGRWERQLKGGW